MEISNNQNKIIDEIIINKKYLRFYSLINKLSIANYLFSQKEIINKENRKKSHDFASKRINIDDANIIITPKRKLTKENISLINDFVPKIKPMKNTIIPSKFLLNNKEEKMLKEPIKHFFSSFSNSESKEKIFYSTKENLSIQNKKKDNFNIVTKNVTEKKSIDEIRIYLIENKIKYIKKNYSSKNFLTIKKSKNKELNNSFESDLNDEEYNYYMSLRRELTNKKEINNNDYKVRTNSMSILNLLEKNFQRKEE